MSTEAAKYAGDAISIGTILASFWDFVPHAAALLSLIWVAIRIWETTTVKGWLGRDRRRGRR